MPTATTITIILRIWIQRWISLFLRLTYSWLLMARLKYPQVSVSRGTIHNQGISSINNYSIISKLFLQWIVIC